MFIVSRVPNKPIYRPSIASQRTLPAIGYILSGLFTTSLLLVLGLSVFLFLENPLRFSPELNFSRNQNCLILDPQNVFFLKDFARQTATNRGLTFQTRKIPSFLRCVGESPFLK